jgi:hypothetical protein
MMENVLSLQMLNTAVEPAPCISDTSCYSFYSSRPADTNVYVNGW